VSESRPALLELRELSVRYGRVPAVERLDLVVRAGEIVALLGANGAGKSSVLRAISGLAPVASGRILLEGIDLTERPAYQRPRLGIGHVPEGRLVFGDQSVEDNLRLGAFHRGSSESREVERNLEALLARFPGLAERRRTPAGSLSGGEQQQLAIARALRGRPRLLLLDEPSLGLAPIVVDQLFELLAEVRAEGLTVLLVEQLAQRALGLAERAYVLAGGRLALEGAAREVAADPRLEAAYLGVVGGG
jgi:branched-chain amino acid transport system ATP-binding protein